MRTTLCHTLSSTSSGKRGPGEEASRSASYCQVSDMQPDGRMKTSWVAVALCSVRREGWKDSCSF